MGAKTGNRLLVMVIVMAVAGAILYFMLREVVRGWPLIAGYSWDLSVPLLTLSLALGVSSAIVAAKAGQVLVEALGATISFRRFLLILCTTQTSRYLPGRIWGVVGLSLMLEREGLQRALAVTLPFVHQGMVSLALVVVGALLFAFPGLEEATGPFDRLVPLMGFFGVAAMALLPLVANSGVRVVGRRLQGPQSFAAAKGRCYGAAGLALLSAITLAGAFSIFIGGVATISWLDAPRLGGAFLLAYVAGWLAFFLPGGIGVREGALACLLGSLFGVPMGSVFALTARAWMTGVEILLLGLVWLWVTVVKREPFLRLRAAHEDSGTPG